MEVGWYPHPSSSTPVARCVPASASQCFFCAESGKAREFWKALTKHAGCRRGFHRDFTGKGAGTETGTGTGTGAGAGTGTEGVHAVASASQDEPKGLSGARVSRSFLFPLDWEARTLGQQIQVSPQNHTTRLGPCLLGLGVQKARKNDRGGVPHRTPSVPLDLSS